MSNKVLVSGIQASGRLHFGNYFAVVKPNIELANSGEYVPYIFIADYHALTTLKNGEELRRATYEIVAAYVACGLDVKKAILFKQSDINEHAELCVILNNVVTVPYIMRAHAFKDHEAKNKEVNVGLFDYPVLMAADILMYQADIVPVGADQKQHVEYARDIAGFYNRAWDVEQFKLPKEHIVEGVATVPGIDGAKMSKSKGNVIPLFGSDEEIKKAVMGIVTDSAAPGERKNPDTNTIYNIHKLFLNEDEEKALRLRFENGGYGYKDAKEDLLSTITSWRKGKKEMFDGLMNEPETIKKILDDGAERARITAKQTILEVKKQIGLE